MIYFIIRSIFWGILLSLGIVVFVGYSFLALAVEGFRELAPLVREAAHPTRRHRTTRPNPTNPNTWQVLRDPLQAPPRMTPRTPRHDEVPRRN